MGVWVPVAGLNVKEPELGIAAGGGATVAVATGVGVGGTGGTGTAGAVVPVVPAFIPPIGLGLGAIAPGLNGDGLTPVFGVGAAGLAGLPFMLGQVLAGGTTGEVVTGGVAGGVVVRGGNSVSAVTGGLRIAFLARYPPPAIAAPAASAGNILSLFADGVPYRAEPTTSPADLPIAPRPEPTPWTRGKFSSPNIARSGGRTAGAGRAVASENTSNGLCPTTLPS